MKKPKFTIPTKTARRVIGEALLSAMSIGFIIQYVPQINKIGVVLIAVTLVGLVLYFTNN